MFSLRFISNTNYSGITSLNQDGQSAYLQVKHTVFTLRRLLDLFMVGTLAVSITLFKQI